jgi:hypothetical protein
MMNMNLHELLPANLSNETAFHVVKFVRDLALALESIYFDKLLQHTSECDHDPFQSESEDNHENPF